MFDAPFRLGEMITYAGSTTIWLPRPGDDGIDPGRGPDIFPGAVGLVVESEAGDRPELLGSGEVPCAPYSVIELETGARAAVGPGRAEWRRVPRRCRPSLPPFDLGVAVNAAAAPTPGPQELAVGVGR